MTMCKDLGFDILALSETHKWRSDTDAIFFEQPEDGDPYSGCCICLSKRAQVDMYEALEALMKKYTAESLGK